MNIEPTATNTVSLTESGPNVGDATLRPRSDLKILMAPLWADIAAAAKAEQLVVDKPANQIAVFPAQRG